MSATPGREMLITGEFELPRSLLSKERVADALEQLAEHPSDDEIEPLSDEEKRRMIEGQ